MHHTLVMRAGNHHSTYTNGCFHLVFHMRWNLYHTRSVAPLGIGLQNDGCTISSRILRMLIQELIDPSRIPVTCEVFFHFIQSLLIFAKQNDKFSTAGPRTTSSDRTLPVAELCRSPSRTSSILSHITPSVSHPVCRSFRSA